MPRGPAEGKKLSKRKMPMQDSTGVDVHPLKGSMARSPATKKSARPTAALSGRRAVGQSHIDVFLIIRGAELDPDAVTHTLGLEPTEIWRKGDRVLRRATRVYKDAGGKLKGKSVQGWVLAKHVEALIKQVERRADRFASLPTDALVYVRCDICDYEFRQTDLGLSRKAVEGLAMIGAEIDIDYYDLSKHATDAS
jgi:hypothetical protein